MTRQNALSSIICANCGAKITPDKMGIEFLMGMARIGETSVEVNCAKCRRETTINPKSLLEGKRSPGKKGSYMYRCPKEGCPGYVCEVVVSKKNVWMCGECGETWATTRDLESAISRIIDRFPYRAGAYVDVEGKWLPNPKEPRQYEDKVEKELTLSRKKDARTRKGHR